MWIISSNHEYGSSCGGLRETIYIVAFMNGVNVIVFGLNLCGLETKVPCCNANVVCFLTTAEIGMLIFMQITYFTA